MKKSYSRARQKYFLPNNKQFAYFNPNFLPNEDTRCLSVSFSLFHSVLATITLGGRLICSVSAEHIIKIAGNDGNNEKT